LAFTSRAGLTTIPAAPVSAFGLVRVCQVMPFQGVTLEGRTGSQGVALGYEVEALRASRGGCRTE
jgi:hypothetical protein